MGNVDFIDILKDFILNVINIVVLFIIVKSLVYKPVIKFLNARKERIAEQKKQAETENTEAQALKAKYELLLKEQSVEKAKVLAEAESHGKQHSDEIVAAATVKAQKIIDDAAARNKVMYDNMLAEAKDDISEMVIQVSSKVLAREITDDDNLKIVNEFLNSRREAL